MCTVSNEKTHNAYCSEAQWNGRRFIHKLCVCVRIAPSVRRQLYKFHFDKSTESSIVSLFVCIAMVRDCVSSSNSSSGTSIYELTMKWQTRNSTECAYWFASICVLRWQQCHPASTEGNGETIMYFRQLHDGIALRNLFSEFISPAVTHESRSQSLTLTQHHRYLECLIGWACWGATATDDATCW